MPTYNEVKALLEQRNKTWKNDDFELVHRDGKTTIREWNEDALGPRPNDAAFSAVASEAAEKDNTDLAKAGLARTDRDQSMRIDTLVDVLVAKGSLTLDDLPAEFRDMYTQRKQWRTHLGQ